MLKLWAVRPKTCRLIAGQLQVMQAFRPVLGPTQIPMYWVPWGRGLLSWG